jgi:uncharacterized protein with PQ loop repeat
MDINIVAVIQVLYVIASVVSVGAGVPQLRKLLVTRRSDEFSVPTWSMWTTTQAISLLYSFTLGDLYFTTVCSIWLVFNVLMLTLIVKYRNNVSPVPAEVMVESQEP